MVASPVVLLVLAAITRRPPQNPEIHAGSAIEQELDVPPAVKTFLRRSCYDCHSFETRWPWYASIPPVAGLIESDVRHGREVMNFSEWPETAGATSSRTAATLSAACEAVRRGIMPKSPYLYLHPEARPSHADIDLFCSWTTLQAAKIRGIHR